MAAVPGASSVEVARRWFTRLHDGRELAAWRLMTEGMRGAYVDGWARMVAHFSSGPITGQLPRPLREDLIVRPDRVTPAPDMWLSLRDYLRGVVREAIPWATHEGAAWVDTPRPVSVDREAAVLVCLPPGPRRTQIVSAVAVMLQLVPEGWRIDGFDDAAEHPSAL